MKMRRLVFGVFSGLAVSVLFASVPGEDRFDVRAGALPLYAKNASGELVINRQAVVARIRQDLGLSPLSRIRIAHLPLALKGPGGAHLSAVLTREADEGSGRYLYLLDLVKEGVARESFYLNVKVEGRTAGAKTVTASPEGGAAASEERSGESLVHAGDTVHVTARGDGFLIRFSGIAQGEGGEGESVPVVNPVSGASMSGQVTGHDAVVVVLGGGHS